MLSTIKKLAQNGLMKMYLILLSGLGGDNMRRRRMTRKGSKKYFSATASKTHRNNLRAIPMRGGFRI